MICGMYVSRWINKKNKLKVLKAVDCMVESDIYICWIVFMFGFAMKTINYSQNVKSSGFFLIWFTAKNVVIKLNIDEWKIKLAHAWKINIVFFYDHNTLFLIDNNRF